MTVSVNHKMNLQDVLMVHFNIRFHCEVVIVIVTIIIIILLIIKMIKTIILIIKQCYNSFFLIIIQKITISSIVVSLKNSFVPLNSLAKSLSDNSISQPHSKLQFNSTNHILSCSLHQPIAILVSITTETVNIYHSSVSLLIQIFPFLIPWQFFFSRKM